MGIGTESSPEHGIEARTGNDVTLPWQPRDEPEMTSSNRKCDHGNWDEPEMEKKSRDTGMDRFKQNFNGFFHGVDALSMYFSCSAGGGLTRGGIRVKSSG